MPKTTNNTTSGGTDFSAICLNESSLLLVSGDTAIFIFHFIFPLQFLLGLTGNVLNLAVLLSKNMRKSRANWFLSSMAFADVLYFLSMTFRCLASFEGLARNRDFYQFYKTRKHAFFFMNNWFSAASIW